jgi:dTDP-4-amino-4,6-dideoxygalactose transaminase
VEHLGTLGIEARRLFRPLPSLPMFAGARAYRNEVARALYARAVSLPSSVNLSVPHQDAVVAAVLEWIAGER